MDSLQPHELEEIIERVSRTSGRCEMEIVPNCSLHITSHAGKHLRQYDKGGTAMNKYAIGSAYE